MTAAFLAVAAAIACVLAGCTWIAVSTWRHFAGAGSAWTVAIPLILGAGFVPALLMGRFSHHPFLRLFYSASAVWVGFLTFGLMATALSWVWDLVAGAAGWNASARPAALFLFGAAAVATLAGLANAFWLRVTRVDIAIEGLPDSWEGRQALLVSDIHLGNILGLRSARRLVRFIERLQPAVVFISGDLFDGARVDWDRMTAPWRSLQPPLGIYFVAGNHDDFTDRVPLITALGKTGVRVLNNEAVEVDGLRLLGIHDAETRNRDTYGRLLAEAGAAPGIPGVLLAHQPSHLEVPEQAGVSLQLSGHTHGGQFWPWTLVASRVHGPHAYGLSRFGRMQVLTSSGAGTWGPPLRLGTRSEVVLIRFRRSPA